jgi:hypothetical protein
VNLGGESSSLPGQLLEVQLVMARNSFSRTSDRERHREDWYAERRFTVEQLLDEEAFEGEVLDQCCGGGTIDG